MVQVSVWAAPSMPVKTHSALKLIKLRTMISYYRRLLWKVKMVGIHRWIISFNLVHWLNAQVLQLGTKTMTPTVLNEAYRLAAWGPHLPSRKEILATASSSRRWFGHCHVQPPRAIRELDANRLSWAIRWSRFRWPRVACLAIRKTTGSKKLTNSWMTDARSWSS